MNNIQLYLGERVMAESIQYALKYLNYKYIVINKSSQMKRYYAGHGYYIFK